jgi:hypothetical protein
VKIDAPDAVHLTTRQGDTASNARAIFAPGEAASFTWKPRVRQTRLEPTVYFVDSTAVWRFGAGFARGWHQLQFQIAQGELGSIRVRVPRGMTVTGARGVALGAWRFDPAAQLFEARLTKAAVGSYRLLLATQINAGQLPYTIAIESLQVEAATRQRGRVALLGDDAVYLAVPRHSQPMSVDDFARDAAAMLKTIPDYTGGDVLHAFRLSSQTKAAPEAVELQAALTVEVVAVRPEIRSAEEAVFTVADDRLVYNGQVAIAITKAGLFSVELAIPQGYDVDALTSAAISHWDQGGDDAARTLRLHFKRKLMGRANVALTLSRSVSALPEQIDVPRIEVVDTLKHVGRMVVSLDRGVRLSVAQRDGVGEVSAEASELNKDQEARRAIAFRLLRADWQLSLRAQVVQPRINIDFLHVAKISEGLVRHTHYQRYRLYNAGTKVFEVQLPQDALGVLITGPSIVRRRELTPGAGLWQIELAGKWYDKPYPLTIRYDTQFDRQAGTAKLLPASPQVADLQRGYVVVRSTDRVELSVASASDTLQLAEARTVPRQFGAADLSDAALCYRSSGGNYQLTLSAKRHDAAKQLEADVLAADITTVVTARGRSISRLEMKLLVAGKGHLQTQLPVGAQPWSLAVNGRAVVPSIQTDSTNRKVLLIRLAPQASGQAPVEVDLVWIVQQPGPWRVGHQQMDGPKFDLPLRNVTWTIYVPDGLEYDDLQGTLKPVDDEVSPKVHRYDVDAYEREVRSTNSGEVRKALTLQQQGLRLAQKGEQRAARQALESAWHYSVADPGLNEDTRVQLRQLNRSQALVGLLGSRDRLRQQSGRGGTASMADRFSAADAERMTNALSKPDSENLELITDRMIQMQEAAAGATVQLHVSMPLRGRVLAFERRLQVEPDALMQIGFEATPIVSAGIPRAYIAAAALFVALLLLLLATGRVVRWCS